MVKKFVFAFTLVVLCAASYAQQQVLAVMPFQTHTEAVSQSEADAVTMEFSNRLSDKKIFIIVPRTDIDNAFKTEIYHQMSDWSDKDKTVEMGKVLNANWILTGSFSWVGTKITLVVTIYEVNTREQKPGGASLRGDDMDDVFDQIDDFVQEIVGKLIAHGGSFGQGDFQPIVPDGFILIKGGSFVMGSSISKAYLHDSEGPLHNVIVSEFYLGKHEVTQAEYRDVMGKNPSNFTGTEFPVESVSWFDAVDYCNRRSLKEGLTPAYTINGKNVTWNRDANGYRLPTEAEWEYACRAGTTTPFRTGEILRRNGFLLVDTGGVYTVFINFEANENTTKNYHTVEPVLDIIIEAQDGTPLVTYKDKKYPRFRHVTLKEALDRAFRNIEQDLGGEFARLVRGIGW
ncbi:hypothetical protein AGMMS49991_06310 [Spirochaetia bacterium]|nr:hypothetical protein AGMMS49991_06310 [Spirochaetia bacterium]